MPDNLKIQKLKIAHTITAYVSAVTILDSKLRLLKKFRNIDIAIISSSNDTAIALEPAITHIPVNMSRTIMPLRDLISILLLYRILKRNKFDIVHSHTAKAGFITVVAAKMARVPLIFHTYHGLPYFEGQKKSIYLVYRFLEKIACRLRNHIFTQNKQEFSECVKLIGDESKVSFEGNGVDIELVTQAAQSQLPKALKDYPGQGLKLVLLSRFEPVKRVTDFLEVVQKLKKDGIEVSCVIAGGGVLEDQLKRYITEKQLDNCVNMIGFTDRPHGLIAASDIVMLCSEKEGIPRCIMEAMALQKPVIATNVIGTQELVLDGETGYLVPLGDIKAMIEKVTILAKDTKLREKMGMYGLKRVRENFNEGKIVKFLVDFYLNKVPNNNNIDRSNCT